MPPAEVAIRAHGNGVDVWALSDHDDLSGLSEAAQAAQELGLQFIPGVEISATFCDKTVHILGLNINSRHEGLSRGLEVVRASRLVRARQIDERLQALGLGECYEGALTYAGNPDLLSRAHFARYLYEIGACRTVQKAFDQYLGEGRAAYVPVQWASLAQSVEWIQAAGGKAVIAHPGRYKYTTMQFNALFEEFKALDGDGIEVITGGHTPRQYVEYAQVARHYGFEASRGSDFHGAESRIDLGRLPGLPVDLIPIWQDWL